MEQVRKGGLPPLLLGLDERGQATLRDLFYSAARNHDEVLNGITITASTPPPSRLRISNS
jgi:hypothetical protein